MGIVQKVKWVWQNQQFFSEGRCGTHHYNTRRLAPARAGYRDVLVLGLLRWRRWRGSWRSSLKGCRRVFEPGVGKGPAPAHCCRQKFGLQMCGLRGKERGRFRGAVKARAGFEEFTLALGTCTCGIGLLRALCGKSHVFCHSIYSF